MSCRQSFDSKGPVDDLVVVDRQPGMPRRIEQQLHHDLATWWDASRAQSGEIIFSQPCRAGRARKYVVQDGHGVASTPPNMSVFALCQAVKLVNDHDRHDEMDVRLP